MRVAVRASRRIRRKGHLDAFLILLSEKSFVDATRGERFFHGVGDGPPGASDINELGRIGETGNTRSGAGLRAREFRFDEFLRAFEVVLIPGHCQVMSSDVRT